MFFHALMEALLCLMTGLGCLLKLLRAFFQLIDEVSSCLSLVNYSLNGMAVIIYLQVHTIEGILSVVNCLLVLSNVVVGLTHSVLQPHYSIAHIVSFNASSQDIHGFVALVACYLRQVFGSALDDSLELLRAIGLDRML